MEGFCLRDTRGLAHIFGSNQTAETRRAQRRRFPINNLCTAIVEIARRLRRNFRKSRSAMLSCTLDVIVTFGRVERFERKGQSTGALQDASARHAARLLPQGFGVRLSSAAFPHGEHWRANNLASSILHLLSSLVAALPPCALRAQRSSFSCDRIS